jgi:hypothetical protein
MNTNTKNSILSVILVIVVAFSWFLMVSTLKINAASLPNTQINWGCATNEQLNTVDFGCPQKTQIVTGPWLLDSWKEYHSNWLQKFSNPINDNKTPYIISYIIAGLARRDAGLTDCDLTKKSICTDGADFIRENQLKIEAEYRLSAQSIRLYRGNKPIYIHMEPDFFLYHRNALQKNPLSQAESHLFMNRLIGIIKSQNPNAKIVMDVSSWNPEMQSWHAGFSNVDYGGLVGKPFSANNSPDGKTYEQITEYTKTPLIVNTAFDFGGGFAPYDPSWEKSNHGVYAVIQSPTNNLKYANFLDNLNVNIATIPFYKVRIQPKD